MKLFPCEGGGERVSSSYLRIPRTIAWNGPVERAKMSKWCSSIPLPNEKVSLSWDGSEEILSPTSGKFDYVHAFQIPWYASGTFVLGLGVLIAVSLAFALTILLWEKRKT